MPPPNVLPPDVLPPDVPPAIPRALGGALIGAGVCGLWLTPADVTALPRNKGAYVLAMRLDRPVMAGLPRRSPVELPSGWYLYLGSAHGPGGLGARIARHFRRRKPLRWHVDRLTAVAAERAALAVPDGDECALTARLLASGGFTVPAPGFGSSDCRRCPSHLLAAGRG